MALRCDRVWRLQPNPDRGFPHSRAFDLRVVQSNQEDYNPIGVYRMNINTPMQEGSLVQVIKKDMSLLLPENLTKSRDYFDQIGIVVVEVKSDIDVLSVPNHGVHVMQGWVLVSFGELGNCWCRKDAIVEVS